MPFLPSWQTYTPTNHVQVAASTISRKLRQKCERLVKTAEQHHRTYMRGRQRVQVE